MKRTMQTLLLMSAGLAILGGCGSKLRSVATVPAMQSSRPSQDASQPATNVRNPPSNSSTPPSETPPAEMPPPEMPAAVREQLETLGARVTLKANGYVIDIRNKPAFSDKDIDLIVQVPQLVDLTMEHVPITDQGLQKLEALPKLTRLILNDCPISSKGLTILSNLPLRNTLTCIGLRATNVMADDVIWIKRFSRLERLDVSQTAVNDSSLQALESLPLQVLNVTRTNVSAAGLEQLKLKKPKLVVKQ